MIRLTAPLDLEAVTVKEKLATFRNSECLQIKKHKAVRSCFRDEEVPITFKDAYFREQARLSAKKKNKK